MKQLNTKASKESTPCGKPVKPKKPVPCLSLTEERVREIAREEILNEKRQRLIDRGIVPQTALVNIRI